MASLSGLSGGIGDLFGGIGSIISAGGDKAEARAYAKASEYALQNATIAQEAGEIRLEQAGRNIYKTLGAQGAGYASAGLTDSGSAQYVLRDSIHQGALEKAIVNEQTQINVTGYKAQSASFLGMQQAADAAASAKKAGGIGSIIGGAIGILGSIFSDRRMKTDIEYVDSHEGVGIYRFRYIGEQRMRLGVMADEVAVHAPHALGPVVGGYATVDYDALGLGHLPLMEG